MCDAATGRIAALAAAAAVTAAEADDSSF